MGDDTGYVSAVVVGGWGGCCLVAGEYHGYE